jgi:hypothetical protein
MTPSAMQLRVAPTSSGSPWTDGWRGSMSLKISVEVGLPQFTLVAVQGVNLVPLGLYVELRATPDPAIRPSLTRGMRIIPGKYVNSVRPSALC